MPEPQTAGSFPPSGLPSFFSGRDIKMLQQILPPLPALGKGLGGSGCSAFCHLGVRQLAPLCGWYVVIALMSGLSVLGLGGNLAHCSAAAHHTSRCPYLPRTMWLSFGTLALHRAAPAFEGPSRCSPSLADSSFFPTLLADSLRLLAPLCTAFLGIEDPGCLERVEWR